MGRIRMHVALDCSAYSLETYILHHIEPGSTIATDALQSYSFIEDRGYRHKRRIKAKPEIMNPCTVPIW